MKRIRILLMLMAFLASMSLANAQDVAPPSPRDLAELEEAARQARSATWYVHATEHAVGAWQRLRAICAGSQMSCEGQASAGVAKPAVGCPAGCAKGAHIQVQATRTGSLLLGVGMKSDAGVVRAIEVHTRPGCGVHELVQFQCPVVAQKASCACSKACACCETCKAKGVVAQWQAVPPAAPPLQMQWIVPQPQVMQPVPPPMPGARIVVGIPTTAQPTKPAHLVTPDLEAHCLRITHKDGLIILEGNVLLLCKKHAQPIRIEAPRVVLNMRDGSFTVEAETLRSITTPAMPAIGVMRTSGIEVVPGTTTQRIIPVAPVPWPASPFGPPAGWTYGYKADGFGIDIGVQPPTSANRIIQVVPVPQVAPR